METEFVSLSWWQWNVAFSLFIRLSIYLLFINYFLCLNKVGCIDVGIICIIYSCIFSLSAGMQQISNHYSLKLVTKKSQIIELDLIFSHMGSMDLNDKECIIRKVIEYEHTNSSGIFLGWLDFRFDPWWSADAHQRGSRWWTAVGGAWLGIR